MRGSSLCTGALALIALLAPIAAAAHGPEGEEAIAVEPSGVTAGDTVVLAGSGLEPDSDRVLVLAGDHLIVDLGTVQSDAEGMFQEELTIPGHLPSGAYELRAIGDETLATPLAITAASGTVEGTPPGEQAGEVVVTPERSPIELVLLAAFIALTGAIGLLLIWRAERLGGASHTA